MVKVPKRSKKMVVDHMNHMCCFTVCLKLQTRSEKNGKRANMCHALAPRFFFDGVGSVRSGETALRGCT